MVRYRLNRPNRSDDGYAADDKSYFSHYDDYRKELDAYYDYHFSNQEETLVGKRQKLSLLQRVRNARAFVNQQVDGIKDDFQQQVEFQKEYFSSTDHDYFAEQQAKRTDRFIKTRLLPALAILSVIMLLIYLLKMMR